MQKGRSRMFSIGNCAFGFKTSQYSEFLSPLHFKDTQTEMTEISRSLGGHLCMCDTSDHILIPAEHHDMEK